MTQKMEIQDHLITYYFEGQCDKHYISDASQQKNCREDQQTFLSKLHRRKDIHESHINNTHLLVIRICAFCYLTGIYIWAIVYERTFLFNIIYLTMQGYFITWLYFGLSLQDYLINVYFKNKQNIPKAPNLKYLTQIVSELAFCSQLPITVVFWVFLFKVLINMDGMTTQIIIQNANLHAGPFICLLLDLIYNNFQYSLRRYSIVIMFGTLYLLINCIYSLSVRVIYQPIDWISWLSYLLIIGSYAMSYLCHFVGRIIYRKWKRERLQTRKYQNQYNIQITNAKPGNQKQEENNESALFDNYNL